MNPQDFLIEVPFVKQQCSLSQKVWEIWTVQIGNHILSPKHPQSWPELPPKQLSRRCAQSRTVRINGNCTGVVQLQSVLSRRELHWSVHGWVPALGQRIRVIHYESLPTPVTLFPPRRFMDSNSVWFGDGHQGNHGKGLQGSKGSQGCHRKS
jgi:hypothetical protein